MSENTTIPSPWHGLGLGCLDQKLVLRSLTGALLAAGLDEDLRARIVDGFVAKVADAHWAPGELLHTGQDGRRFHRSQAGQDVVIVHGDGKATCMTLTQFVRIAMSYGGGDPDAIEAARALFNATEIRLDVSLVDDSDQPF